MNARSHVLVNSTQLEPLLQGARKSLKMTQTQMGQRLGLSQRRVSELEREPGTLSVDQLLAICAQLGLRVILQSEMVEPIQTYPYPASQALAI